MRKTILWMLAPLLVFVLVLAGATSALATKPAPEHKVTLCHRTGSATNPYVIITTDIASDGYVKHGHTYHEQIGNGLGGDIIPAYTYGDFSFPGKNLDAIIGGYLGADILAAGCSSPGVTPTPTPTVTPTETPTPPPSTTPPTKPPHTPTWTPTWHPTGGATPGEHPLASTGFTAGKAAGAAAALAGLGLSALYWVRRKATA